MSNIIGDLQKKLTQSWQESDDNVSRQHSQDVADISTLAFNLSSQTEYNNELLEYIRDLELNLQTSETLRHELSEKYESLLESNQEISERADDLYHKLQISSSLCDELSAQLKALRDDTAASKDDADQGREALESLKQQNQYLEKSNRHLTERVHRMESEIDAAQRLKKSILTDETAESIATLTFTLESTQQELERTRREHLEMQLTATEVRDENIQLMRRMEHLTKQREDDASHRDASMAKLRETTVLVSDLQQQCALLTTQKEHLEESLSVAMGRIKHSHTARDQAVEHSLQTDLRWRELEEMCKQLQTERSELQRVVETTEEKNQLLMERVKSLQQKDREWERAVREDCDRTVENYVLKMEDMSRQLEAVKTKYDMENDQQADALKTATSQIEQLNMLLSKCREELSARGAETKSLREESEAKEAQLETIISEMREEKRIALLQDREEISLKKREIQNLREQLISRGERYSVTVGALHDAIHAIGGEASFIKEQFQYISSQQERLLVLMKELRKSQAVVEVFQDSSGEGERQGLPPHQSALQAYGMEIRKTFRVLVSKLTETKEELETANNKVSGQRHEIQTLKHICEEQDGKLVSLQEKLSFAKGTIARLEKQCEEAVNSNKDLAATMQQERDRSASRLEKAEERVSDMIKQNTQCQTELMRVQSQLEATKKESDLRNSGLNKKIQKIVENRDFYVEAAKNSDSKYSMLQDELMKAEAKIAKQHADFQKLKKISISMRDDIKKLTTQRNDQVSALSRALEQCRVQLDQKQQLIATLQAQRSEMMSSGRSPSETVPFVNSYSHSNAIDNLSRSVAGHQHSFTRSRHIPGMEVFKATGRPSSSAATSSSNALSGLANLIHSYGIRRDDALLSSSRTMPRDNERTLHPNELTSSTYRSTLSRVKAAKGEMDIGDSVFHSSLKHLSATVNQIETEDSSLTFRAPALQPSPREALASEHYEGNAELSHRFRKREARDPDPLLDSSSDIFRLTSPSKVTDESYGFGNEGSSSSDDNSAIGDERKPYCTLDDTDL